MVLVALSMTNVFDGFWYQALVFKVVLQGASQINTVVLNIAQEQSVKCYVKKERKVDPLLSVRLFHDASDKHSSIRVRYCHLLYRAISCITLEKVNLDETDCINFTRKLTRVHLDCQSLQTGQQKRNVLKCSLIEH